MKKEQELQKAKQDLASAEEHHKKRSLTPQTRAWRQNKIIAEEEWPSQASAWEVISAQSTTGQSDFYPWATA